jgi:hypothetical protein
MTDHAVESSNPPIEVPQLVAGETRIRDVDGFVGTVVYVGAVASAKNPQETYAGIVWDDPSRGKHDGSVLCRTTNRVVRHFGGCGPTQGSFLRLNNNNNNKKTLDRGVALTLELLQSKYVGMQAPVIAPNNVLPHTARTSSGRDKPIEFLGELQIRQRQQLEDIHKVSLRREGISRAYPLLANNKLDDSTNDSLIRNIRDVDLAGNLLSNWKTVVDIMQQFPNLTDFSVAYNRIQDVSLPLMMMTTTTTTMTMTPPLDRIKVLNLNHCDIKSFQTLVWVAKSMPSLESLCIASSDLSDMMTMMCDQKQSSSSTSSPSSPSSSVDALEGLLPHLRVLDCSDCQLSSWTNQVEAFFGKLPSLEQLSLDDNPIPCIPTTTTKPDHHQQQQQGQTEELSSVKTVFSSLRSLQLAGTTISTWTDLEGLNTAIPNLQSLRLKNTPLTSTMGQGEVRFMCIARIPTLSYLNGSVVSSKERTEAERRYVTMVSHLLVKMEQQHTLQQQGETTIGEEESSERINKARQDLLAEHPQYNILLETHKGLILPSSSSSASGMNGTHNGGKSSLGSSVCNVTISSMSASSCSIEPLIRRLPGTLTVGRLKALCARAFGLDIDLMILHFRTEVCMCRRNRESMERDSLLIPYSTVFVFFPLMHNITTGGCVSCRIGQ